MPSLRLASCLEQAGLLAADSINKHHIWQKRGLVKNVQVIAAVPDLKMYVSSVRKSNKKSVELN
jgi:hypothetical protein